MFDSEISEYVSEQTQLSSGDMVVLYTDGIPDAANEDEENFGDERLLEIIRQNKEKSAEEIKDKIYDEVTKFVGDAPQFDDLTVLILKVL